MECDEYLKGQEKARRRQEDITTARIQKMSVQEEQVTEVARDGGAEDQNVEQTDAKGGEYW